MPLTAKPVHRNAGGRHSFMISSKHDCSYTTMAAVKQQVLNWLYSVLTSEYKDVNRTYNDVAQTLSHYSSLSPRTDVYTYEDGTPALLLHLSGTLPVNFRGTTYRFPIALWVPHAYPREPPLIYVTPTEGMMVRPGQHVDPQGKIYHPYLVGWAEFWDKSNILDFIAILRDIFAKEPPVLSRQQQATPPRPQVIQAPPPIPPSPHGIARPASGISESPRQRDQAGPPPPPPKPGQSSQGTSLRQQNGPPLPPLPPQDGNRYGSPPFNVNSHAPQRSSSLRYQSAPPLPQQPSRQQSMRDSPVSPISPPQPSYAHPSFDQQNQQPPQIQGYQHHQPQNRHTLPPSYNQPQPQYQNQPQQRQQYPPQGHPPPQAQPKPAPPVDLLDGPLTLSIPEQGTTNLAPPPIPPNPEKDMLLHNLGRAIASQRLHTKTQTTSSLPGLEAQHKAMLSSLAAMQAEIQALESLTSLLNTNSNILHTALHDADKVIEDSQHRTTTNVDELLVAPTVVGNQLYELISEERSLGDTLFVLGRAVEKGRVSPAVFAKLTRSMAREWYLKKALAKKIGRGMGLAS